MAIVEKELAKVGERVNRLISLSRARVWVTMLVLTLVGAFLRFYDLPVRSVWDGEIFTLLFAQYDWEIFLPSVAAFSAHPPLWFAFTKFFVAGGWNEFLLRIPAVMVGILAIPALYILGKRLFNARVGLLSAALLAFSPLAVLYAQNARNYTLFVLLIVLMLYSVARAMATSRAPNETLQKRFDLKRARWWLLFAFVGALGLYTHYLFLLPLAGIVLAVGLKVIYDAVRQNRRGWLGAALTRARPFLVALIVLGALYLPWTPAVGSAFLDRQLTREDANQDEEWDLSWQDVPRTLKDFSGDATWGLGLFAALAVIGVGWTARREKRAALFWLGVSLMLPIALMVILAPRRLPVKYLIFVLPAYLMFVAGGIVAVTDVLRQRVLHSAPRAAFAGFAVFALLLIATLPNMPYWNGTRTVFTGKGWKEMDVSRHWREAAQEVTTRAAPGDLILFPLAARALTSRSIVPYFDAAFLQKIYSAPPTGRAWWIGLQEDLEPTNAPRVRETREVDDIVIQELGNANAFAQIPLSNASFENGLSGWQRTGNEATWIQDSQQAVDGSASLRVTLQRAKNTAVRSAEFPVTQGKLFRVTAYVKNPTSGFYSITPQLSVNFYESNNASPKRTRLPIIVPTDKADWALMVVDGIVPAGVSIARIEFGIRDYAFQFEPTSWLDDVRVWMEK